MAADRQRYKIGLHGCDDTTFFELLLTHEQYETVDRLVVAAEHASEYGCQPTMSVEEVAGDAE